MIEGDAALTADGNVRVGEQSYSARDSVILATGSVPRSIPGVEFGGRVIGTEQAWALQELPARLAVVGAGASGAEIASGYARLGTEVRLLEALDRVLPTEDADISRLVERGFKRQGIDVHTGDPIADVAERRGERHVHATASEPAEVDYLVIAAGRGADVEGLGLDRGRHRARRARPGQGRRRDAHLARRRLRDRRPRRPARRSRTRPPTRASSPPRTPPACRRTRSPTSTSRARRSARRTSARSG